MRLSRSSFFSLALCWLPVVIDGYSSQDDFSWAITSTHLSTPEHQAVYDEFMQSCDTHAMAKEARNCDADEENRLRMNTLQPRSVYNYTSKGYLKMKAPQELRDRLFAFWQANQGQQVNEWDTVNVYHNTWDSPPDILHVTNSSLQGGGPDFQSYIWDVVQDVLEEWTGQALTPCSLWGVRVYKNNSILTPHVDRMPLVSSAIINVAQSVDEPWPLEVFDHSGRAENVTMEPGDMVLYESHSVIHGRPFPLRGEYFANVFVHFEPTGPLRPNNEEEEDERAEDSNGLPRLPPYLVPGSPWESIWRSTNPEGWEKASSLANPHFAALSGDLDSLRVLAQEAPESLVKPDSNGWQPIHEACRSGQLNVLEFLLEQEGIDINQRTVYDGVSPLYLARYFLEPNHPVTKLLHERGAVMIGPTKKNAAAATTSEL